MVLLPALQKSADRGGVINAERLRSVVRAAAFVIALGILSNAGWAQDFRASEFGTEQYDDGTAIAVDATGVYVAGRTEGVLPGQVKGGKIDGFVRKYDFSGIEIWTRQFSFNDNLTEPFAIAVDDTGVYVAGRNLCSSDVGDRCGGFARKMNQDGNTIWTHFFAPSGNLATTILEAWGIAVDGSGIYVTGDGTDGSNPTALVSRLDQMGNEIWTRTAGTPGAHASGVAVNATGVYVAGTLETADVRRFDMDGNVTAEYGLGMIQGGIRESLVLDDSGIYVSGVPCPPCQFAVTVRKYAYDGTIVWTSEAAPELFLGGDLAIDGQGVYLTGSFPTASAFVRSYDKDDGKVAWTVDLGPPAGGNAGDGLAAYAGNVYMTGSIVHICACPPPERDPGNVFVARVNEGPLPLSADGSTLNVAQSQAGGILVTNAGKWNFGATSNANGKAVLLNLNGTDGWATLLEVANGGQLYAQAGDGSWWLWTNPGWSFSAAPPGPVSPDGSTLTVAQSQGGGALVTSAGRWNFGTASNVYGHAVLLNLNGTDGWATLLEVANGGQLYARAGDGSWWLWTNPGWSFSTTPSGNQPSPDGSTLTPQSPAGQVLVTSAGSWNFGTASNAYGNAVLLNGGGTDGWATLLRVANGGQLYAQAGDGSWWRWDNLGWSFSAAPP